MDLSTPWHHQWWWRVRRGMCKRVKGEQTMGLAKIVWTTESSPDRGDTTTRPPPTSRQRLAWANMACLYHTWGGGVTWRWFGWALEKKLLLYVVWLVGGIWPWQISTLGRGKKAIRGMPPSGANLPGEGSKKKRDTKTSSKNSIMEKMGSFLICKKYIAGMERGPWWKPAGRGLRDVSGPLRHHLGLLRDVGFTVHHWYRRISQSYIPLGHSLVTSRWRGCLNPPPPK